MRVAILGCGPAGLMAAAAAHWMGADVEIYSKPRKSHLFGAQYLHKPIPGYTEFPPVLISYQVWGSPEDYRRKVYGPTWDGTVSPEDMTAEHDGWDIRQTYDALWARYGERITPMDLGDARGLADIVRQHDLVISSIPANVLCYGRHEFLDAEVWAAGDAPQLGINVIEHMHIPVDLRRDNIVICTGSAKVPWYRASRIYGHVTVEWPEAFPAPPIPSAARVSKPLRTNCICWPGIVRVGRYGMWTKGILSHEAYWNTVEALERAA